MPGMPLEADRLETLGGLLDKQLVFADGTERPQGEWLKVGAAPQERRSLPQAGQKRASPGIPLPQRRQKEVVVHEPPAGRGWSLVRAPQGVAATTRPLPAVRIATMTIAVESEVASAPKPATSAPATKPKSRQKR